MFTSTKQRLALFLLVALSLAGSTSSRQLHPDEAAALETIKRTLGVNKSVWPDGDPCLRLNGTTFGYGNGCENGSVICDCTIYGHDNCHITQLCFKSTSFAGSLPPEIANLAHLQRIDLTRNYLFGPIPPKWASLKNLNYISLTANRLSGNIPKWLSKLTSLTYLSLEANLFNGTIPDELGSLVSLTDLILSSNQLEGQLPNTFAQLINLEDFRASDNQLSGTIPTLIGNWTNLSRLELYMTGMEGPVPPAIFYLEKLTDLRITDVNGSEFQIPNNVPTKLETLILRNVKLSGQIPKAIWNIEKLVDLTFNKLQGELPNQDNLPKSLYLSRNNLSGNVPDKFSQTKEKVDLSYNNLSWPSNCRVGKNINTYRSSSLTKNMSGLLPCLNLPSCTPTELHDSFHINCGGEEVTVKNDFGLLTYDADNSEAMSFFNSNSNWGFSNTGSYMDKSNVANTFTFENESALVVENAELYTTARGSPLSLTYFGYCLQNGNYTVRLHFAEISMTEEKEYLKVGRRLFDIYVQGKLEQRDFDIKKAANGSNKDFTLLINATVTDTTLEIRLYWAGKGTTCIPSRGNYGPLISAISVCSSLKEHCEVKPSSTTRKVPLIVGTVTSAICLIFFVMGFLYWKYYFQDRYIRKRDLQGLELQTGTFTLRQLKAATRNFDPMNKLGEGGFGAVYKGELADGTFIAVKQLSSKSKQGNHEFVNEIGMISGLHHPNLVKLYGCCIEGNDLLLVYEYMENNSLAHAIFAKNSEEPSGPKLDWQTRLRICEGIARGLAFLHEGSTLRIVHRDIKATNVLLDKDLNAKISDFGLAKLNEEENTHISTRVAGTIGYMSPEYALWGYLTDKTDVYAFGVVALEIVSGKNNSTYRPQDGCVCLLDWAFVLQKNGNIMDIVDPRLVSKFNEEEATRIIKIALLCTNASPSLRPTMSEVVSMLEGQRDVKELDSDNSIYGDTSHFKALKQNFQPPQDFMSGSNQAPSASSVSGQDLYPVRLESEKLHISESTFLLS